jgi:hypothetical protein
VHRYFCNIEGQLLDELRAFFLICYQGGAVCSLCIQCLCTMLCVQLLFPDLLRGCGMIKHPARDTLYIYRYCLKPSPSSLLTLKQKWGRKHESP